MLRLQLPGSALYKLPSCLLLIYQTSIWLYTLKVCSSIVIRERHQRTRELLVAHSQPGSSLSMGTHMKSSLSAGLAKSTDLSGMLLPRMKGRTDCLSTPSAACFPGEEGPEAAKPEPFLTTTCPLKREVRSDHATASEEDRSHIPGHMCRHVRHQGCPLSLQHRVLINLHGLCSQHPLRVSSKAKEWLRSPWSPLGASSSHSACVKACSSHQSLHTATNSIPLLPPPRARLYRCPRRYHGGRGLP